MMTNDGDDDDIIYICIFIWITIGANICTYTFLGYPERPKDSSRIKALPEFKKLRVDSCVRNVPMSLQRPLAR